MSRDVIFRCQYFTGVLESRVANLRSDPVELANFLKENPGPGLDRYWHAVAYLITGQASRLKEPVRWFTGGGEVLGRNDAGEIRYLSPDRVGRLAKVLAKESPDELGHTQYDEQAMDEAGVYPQRWVRDATNYDQLGTIRELYSYVREFLMSCEREQNGVIIYLKEERAFTEEEDEVTPPTPAAPAQARVQPAGEAVLVGAHGKQYMRADACAHPNVTPQMLQEAGAVMQGLGYVHVGDMFGYGTDVMRAYISKDRTVVALAYFSERGLGSWTFLAPLQEGALVVASDAFTQEIKKTKLFGLSLSKSTPAALHASVLERRVALSRSHGGPVILQPNLAAAAAVWDMYGAKSRIGWRR